MKKRSIIILALIVVIAAGIATYFVLKNKTKNKPEWVTEQVLKKDIQLLVTATGSVNAIQTVQVGTQVSGVIAKILVDYNDRVQQGQVIAQLDRANLNASLQQANANLIKARSLLTQARNEFDRNNLLFDKKVIPRSDYDVSLSNFQTAQTAVTVAEADVAKANTNLHYATIKAPINGVIISRNVDVGQTVAASFSTPTLFVIANDLKKMQLTANVDEADIGQVKLGQQVKFTVDAYPDQYFSGMVSQIRLQPNIVQNVVNYSVMIDAPNPDLKLMPGMNADISIIVAERKDVLAVPLAAIKFKPAIAGIKDTAANSSHQFNDKNKQTVYRLENGKLVPRHIRTGLSDGVFVEVISNNLPAGSELIVGAKGKENNLASRGLFQAPRQGTRSPMRGLR